LNDTIALASEKFLGVFATHDPISAQGVASGTQSRNTPSGPDMMDSPNKTTSSKTTSTSGAQAFRATAENGAAQAKESFEKVRAATADATTVMKNSYSTAIQGAQDYQAKVMEFANSNTEAAFEFAQKMAGVKSPSQFFELSSNHSREQFEKLTEQAKELATLAQKVTMAAVEPLKTGATKAFGQLS
jgi:phasin